MAEKVPKITLNNGYVMPGFGLGTYEVSFCYFLLVKFMMQEAIKHYDIRKKIIM